MKLLWPYALWVLVLLPVFLAGYAVRVLASGRVASRKRGARDFVAAVAAARRSGPAALVLFSAALALAAFSLSRPHARLVLPVQSARVVLVIDVSASMTATDLGRSRLEVAKAMARRLVTELPQAVQVGVVSVADTPAWLVTPTPHKSAVLRAIERLETRPGTPLGTALAVAIAMLYPEAGIEPEALDFGAAAVWPGAARASSWEPNTPSHATALDESAAIVLLSDGQSTAGPDPGEAARLAATLGVRIYPIGIGTREGQRLQVDGWSMRVRLDETALVSIARITQGRYLAGHDARDFRSIHDALAMRLAFEEHYSEVTGLFAIAAAVLVSLSALLSVRACKRIL